MKLLKIEENCGHFRKETGDYSPVDKISKDDLLILVNWTLDKDDVEIDEYDEKTIKNQAHQIIYKSIARKLQDLIARRQEFLDQSKRLYLPDYEKYREASAAE